MKEHKTYQSSGFVYGKLWGGGEGAYPAREINSNNKERLKKEIVRSLKNGSLDAGMGFESLLGALINITTITKIYKNKKWFENKENELILFGDLDEGKIDFLTQQFFN